jgi:CheY-like chemotaxis protein
MRASFVSFVQNRYLLADLAYAMLDRGQVEVASEPDVRSVVSMLLADSDKSYGFNTVDEFLQRVYATELLSLKDGAVQWQSSKAQAYLAVLRLHRRYRDIDQRNEQEAAMWLQERATLAQWQDPIALMSYYVGDKEKASRIAKSLIATAPSVAAYYRKCLEEGVYEKPWSEREFLFLIEIAFSLGDVDFWERSLGDCDPDTRWQAALVLGIARVAEAEGLLVGILSDEDDRVRSWGAWALGQLVAADKTDYLTPLLRDPSWRVRYQARRALALVQGDEGRAKFTARFSVEGTERAGKRILVSDDEPELLDLYRLILEQKKGHNVLGVLGGEQTLELARRERPDLVTTDILNPHMMGTDLILKLRSDAATRGIPIAVVSAYYLPWLGLFVGADAYLRAPVGPGELVALIDEVLFA